jgi:hypothetical protein
MITSIFFIVKKLKLKNIHNKFRNIEPIIYIK